MVELFNFFSFSQKIDCCRHCLCKHTKAYKVLTENMSFINILYIFTRFLHSNFTRIHYYCVHSTHGSTKQLSKCCLTAVIVGEIILCSQIWVWRVIWWRTLVISEYFTESINLILQTESSRNYSFHDLILGF